MTFLPSTATGTAFTNVFAVGVTKAFESDCLLSRYMFHEHPFLKKQLWGQHFWSRGYFCASSGTVTDEVIKEYIEHQNKPHDDGFDAADDAQ